MSALKDLADELGVDADALKARLLAADEALVPTYLTVDAQGRVSASFTGHVLAHGIDLNAGLTSDSDIDWWDDALAKSILYSQIHADSGTGGNIEISAGDPRPPSGRYAQLGLQANDPAAGAGHFRSSIRAVAKDTIGGSVNQLLLRSDGASDFLQLATTGNVRLTFGSVAVALAAVADKIVNVDISALGLTNANQVVAVAAITDRRGAAIPPTYCELGGSPTTTNVRIDVHTYNEAATTGTYTLRYLIITSQ